MSEPESINALEEELKKLRESIHCFVTFTVILWGIFFFSGAPYLIIQGYVPILGFILFIPLTTFFLIGSIVSYRNYVRCKKKLQNLKN